MALNMVQYQGPPATSVGRGSSLGHCITMQDTLPAHPVLHSLLRHCHLAAWHSSLVVGAAPSQNSRALLHCRPNRVRFHAGSLKQL